jgi:hypothetical protein
MNKVHFQTMFGTTTGNVYRFVGEIPESQDPAALITEKFIQVIGTDLVSIVVVNTKNIFIVYTNYTDIVEDMDFVLITDLTPDPIIEQPVIIAEDVPVEGE